jgi:hypothetical protein
MNTPRVRVHFPLWLFFIILFAPVPALGQRLHPKLKQARPGAENPVISRIVVLSAEVSLSKDGMKGDEPLEKEAAAATPIIERAMAKALIAKNMSVLDNPYTAEALQNDEKLKYAAADLRRNYDDLLVKIRKNQKDIEKSRFSLGDQVLLLNPDDSIDAFVFVNAFGERKSGGKKALGIIMMNPLMVFSTYTFNIGVIDARTGEVLAYTQFLTTLDASKEDDKNLVAVLTKSLKKFPSGPAAEKK